MAATPAEGGRATSTPTVTGIVATRNIDAALAQRASNGSANWSVEYSLSKQAGLEPTTNDAVHLSTDP